MAKRVAIVDYGLGNIFSVGQALARVGFECRTTDDTAMIAASDALVLPGVGAFGDAMARLNERGIGAAVRQFVASGRPVLGICLGMQLLFASSEESPGVEGLMILPGRVARFVPSVPGEKVPQIQWNHVRFQEPPGVLFANMGAGAFMYFLHSFYVVPETTDTTAGVAEYGGLDYCCAVESGNVLAVQFHPERSGDEGLQILQNFHHFVRLSS